MIFIYINIYFLKMLYKNISNLINGDLFSELILECGVGIYSIYSNIFDSLLFLFLLKIRGDESMDEITVVLLSRYKCLVRTRQF